MAFVAASAVKSARAAKKAPAGGGRGRRNIAGMSSPDEVKAELEARRINAKHEARNRRDDAATASDPAEQADETAAVQADETAAVPPPTSSGGGPSLPGMGAAATGSGFLLGVVCWGFGLAYLRGGMPEVRRLAAAKFFNKVEA